MSMVFTKSTIRAAETSNNNAIPTTSATNQTTRQSYQISFLALQKSGHAITLNFCFITGLHDYAAVAKFLKNKCDLTMNPTKIADKIFNAVEAQRSGQNPPMQDDIAILDDALYSMSRDVSQEVLLKDLRKYGKQQSDLNKVTVEQLEAIEEEKNRHEKELDRIEQARTEAGRAREDRLKRASKEQQEEQQQEQQQQLLLQQQQSASTNGNNNANITSSDGRNIEKLVKPEENKAGINQVLQ